MIQQMRRKGPSSASLAETAPETRPRFGSLAETYPKTQARPATTTDFCFSRCRTEVRWRWPTVRVMEAFIDGLMTVYRWPRMIRDALYVDLCETEHCPAGFLSGGYSSAPSEALLSAEPPADFVSSGPPPGVGWRSTSSSTSGSEARQARDQTAYRRVDGRAVYCPDCQMWLNGPEQWHDHLIGKKHRKNIGRTY